MDTTITALSLGPVLSSLTPFEKAVHRRAVCRMSLAAVPAAGCVRAAACTARLLRSLDGVHLNSSQCTGCGLCVQRCLQDCFTWKRSDMKAARHSTSSNAGGLYLKVCMVKRATRARSLTPTPRLPGRLFGLSCHTPREFAAAAPFSQFTWTGAKRPIRRT